MPAPSRAISSSSCLAYAKDRRPARPRRASGLPVPDAFGHYRSGPWPTKAAVQRYRPRVILISRTGTGRHVWPLPDTRIEDFSWSVGALDQTPQVAEAIKWLMSKEKRKGKRRARYLPVFQSSRFIVFADLETAKRWKSSD
jgi:hypothetical protein